MSREHTLKSYTDFYLPMVDGTKPFDIRYNDRGFQKGDTIVYREWDPNKNEFTGATCRMLVTYVMTYGLSPNYVALGLANLGASSLTKHDLDLQALQLSTRLAGMVPDDCAGMRGWPGTLAIAREAIAFLGARK